MLREGLGKGEAVQNIWNPCEIVARAAVGLRGRGTVMR